MCVCARAFNTLNRTTSHRFGASSFRNETTAPTSLTAMQKVNKTAAPSGTAAHHQQQQQQQQSRNVVAVVRPQHCSLSQRENTKQQHQQQTPRAQAQAKLSTPAVHCKPTTNSKLLLITGDNNKRANAAAAAVAAKSNHSDKIISGDACATLIGKVPAAQAEMTAANDAATAHLAANARSRAHNERTRAHDSAAHIDTGNERSNSSQVAFAAAATAADGAETNNCEKYDCDESCNYDDDDDMTSACYTDAPMAGNKSKLTKSPAMCFKQEIANYEPSVANCVASGARLRAKSKPLGQQVLSLMMLDVGLQPATDTATTTTAAAATAQHKQADSSPRVTVQGPRLSYARAQPLSLIGGHKVADYNDDDDDDEDDEDDEADAHNRTRASCVDCGNGESASPPPLRVRLPAQASVSLPASPRLSARARRERRQRPTRRQRSREQSPATSAKHWLLLKAESNNNTSRDVDADDDDEQIRASSASSASLCSSPSTSSSSSSSMSHCGLPPLLSLSHQLIGPSVRAAVARNNITGGRDDAKTFGESLCKRMYSLASNAQQDATTCSTNGREARADKHARTVLGNKSNDQQMAR